MNTAPKTYGQIAYDTRYQVGLPTEQAWEVVAQSVISAYNEREGIKDSHQQDEKEGVAAQVPTVGASSASSPAGGTTDPVCLIHGKKMSEHNCLYCCLCFKSLTPDQCAFTIEGKREDVCLDCAKRERDYMIHATKEYNHLTQMRRNNQPTTEAPDWKSIAEGLWGLLDDISTACDHYKPNLKDKYVVYVNAKAGERGKFMNSPDGQTLVPCDKIPEKNTGDPMVAYFKDAAKIQREAQSPESGDTFHAGMDKAIETLENWRHQPATINGIDTLMDMLKRERDEHRPVAGTYNSPPLTVTLQTQLAAAESECDRLKEELTEAKRQLTEEQMSNASLASMHKADSRLLEAAAEKLESCSKSPWIPCSERMPTKEEECDERVLVCWIDADNPSDIGMEIINAGSLDQYGPRESHLHWMPIPPRPPKPQEDDAESLAKMVIEWVEGGIRLGTDWKSTLANPIRQRLQRLASRKEKP